MLPITHRPRQRTAPRVRVSLLWLLFSCALAARADGALAQTTPSAGVPDSGTAGAKSLQTVIVTAQRKAQSVAKVPLSITVFTAQNLQDFNIQSFDDYASKTPNLSFTYGAGATGIADARTVSIRGITGQNLGATSGATGFYIDDTPVPASIDPRVLDISNIEVLKGPQGTLFGEGSLGGNVRLITNQPDLTTNGGSYMAQTGDHLRWRQSRWRRRRDRQCRRCRKTGWRSERCCSSTTTPATSRGHTLRIRIAPAPATCSSTCPAAA